LPAMNHPSRARTSRHSDLGQRGTSTAAKYRNTGRKPVDAGGLWRTNDHCSERSFQTLIRCDLYFASRGSGVSSPPKRLARCTLGAAPWRCTLGCDNFLYGFKGGPSARQARAEPAPIVENWDREVPERDCVIECERDHLDLIGELAGRRSAPVAARPASPGMWLLAVTRSPAPRQV
jgi:hypothetical protein